MGGIGTEPTGVWGTGIVAEKRHWLLGRAGGEETGAGLLEDSMSCAQCIRKVLKTAKAPHQTYTAVNSTAVPTGCREAAQPPRPSHSTPEKGAPSPLPLPHTTTAWPRCQSFHPCSPGLLTTPEEVPTSNPSPPSHLHSSS